MTDSQLPLSFEPTGAIDVDTRARQDAVDPARNVALAASAGTGKTRILVDRYVNLLRAGVDPASILAITFTRKAAAEMRQRILRTLRLAAGRGDLPAALWRDLKDRLGEVSISTIDAFCLTLLRAFPLEADLDPGFEIADETEVPRLVDEALDRALGILRSVARDDQELALVFAQLGERRLRVALASLLDRRLVADDALARYAARAPRELTVASACLDAARRLARLFESMPGGVERFLTDGPLGHPRYELFVRDVRRLCQDPDAVSQRPERLRAVVETIAAHFLTRDGKPRQRLTDYKAEHCASPAGWTRHVARVRESAPEVLAIVEAYERDLNVALARGVRRAFGIACSEYRRTLRRHAVLDFAELVERALSLLDQMDEFARSRYLLESRYQHVLVDEFQDTSRAQWRLVRQLVRAWGEGAGLAGEGRLPPSIFIVGDAKQSIYGFRDADPSLFGIAGRFIDSLRPGERSKRSITRNFRSAPALLAFANDLFTEIGRAAAGRSDGFEFGETDRFPVEDGADEADSALGIAAADDVEGCVRAVADEIVRLLETGVTVRDRETGLRRAIAAGDIAILFRSRESHREFEQALEERRVPAYVYKGLGFFDADEIKDSMALLRYLARPWSDLRAAAFMRSRFVRLSDEALKRMAGHLAAALTEPLPAGVWNVGGEDRAALEQIRTGVAAWLPLVDRLPPAELFDHVLADSAYAVEIAGPRLEQARENLKKMRALVRRIQNRGYATLARIAGHLDRLSAGDESNAVIDAHGAVSLMTVHAAKGLEFPVVFVVNLARGTGGRRPPIRVRPGAAGDEDDGDGPDPASAGAQVSIGDLVPDAAEESSRDREETKRLLYVAVTRARDRLYLASVLKEGRLRPAPGSLAEVLPQMVRDLFTGAATSTDPRLAWLAASGRRHQFVVCRPAERPIGLTLPERSGPESPDDFEPIGDPSAIVRSSVTEAVRAASESLAGDVAGQPQSPADDAEGDEGEELLVGRLVHRLVQSRPPGAGRGGADAIRALADTLLLPEERTVATDGVLDEVVRVYLALADHPEGRLVADGECFFEVPFSLARDTEPPVVLRGVIDCLIRRPDGETVVMEIKTGRPRPAHQSQLDVYVEATRHLFPGSAVRGVLIYPV